MGFGTDFGWSSIRHLQRRLKGQTMWTAAQLTFAESICADIDKCRPIDHHLSLKAVKAIKITISKSDVELVNSILESCKRKSLRPWCCDTFRIGISLAATDSPPLIRQAMDDILGSGIEWD